MRALTLGELVLVNILRDQERLRGYSPDELRRALRLKRYKPPLIKVKPMPRVGFKGLKAYHLSALGELDNRADQLADRIDKIKARGLDTIGKHNHALDSMESQIDEMDSVVREGSNGGPLPA